LHAVSSRRRSPRSLVLSVSVLALLAVCALAGRAQAAELFYWDNYGVDPQTIAFANSDGSGGGALNLTGTSLLGPEGMAIDTVTGKLFVASSNGGPDKKGQILFANLDGSGAGVFSAPGAPVVSPFGVVVDPVTRMIYWANGSKTAPSIAWAKLDGSAGGTLNTVGATLSEPYKIALDPINGRVYWGNYPSLVISYANVNNSGGADLTLTPAPGSAYAFAVDPAAGRLYLSEGEEERFAYTGLLGGALTVFNTAGALTTSSYGFAVDPTANKIIWPNYENNSNRVNGLGFASLGGGGGGNITPATAPFNRPQDLLVLKSPTATAAPVISRAKGSRSTLTCPTGGWAADFAGSFVYQAPTTYSYAWVRNGQPVAGAVAPTLKTTKPGSYNCAVTAANQAGASTQTATAVKVNSAKAKLTTKKKVTVKAGGIAAFKLKVVNQGDIEAKKAKACAILPKSARGALKAPKCKPLKLKGRAKKNVMLKVKTLPAASGLYSVSFKVKGLAGKPVKAKIQVLPAK
jgi:hypothetical protein